MLLSVYLLHCIEGVDDDEEKDHKERHSARNNLDRTN